MVTIKDVANLSQTTVSAVSLILNGKPHTYSKETEKRVIKVASEVGYRPRAYAQSMRSGRFNQVTVLMGAGQAESSMQDELFKGLQAEVQDRKQRLGVARVDDDTFADRQKTTSYISQWAADGFLLNYNYGIPEALVEHLSHFKLPHVYINYKQDFDAVRPDDYQAGYKAAQVLLERGHRRIAYIRYDQPDELHYSRFDRRQGCLDAVAVAGHKAEVLAMDSNAGQPQVAEIRELLRHDDAPTAWITYSPQTAANIYIAALYNGLQPGRDLSIITFTENDGLPRGMNIAYLEVPFLNIGHRAVSMLLDKIDAGAKAKPSPTQIIPMSLVEGGTISTHK